MTTTAATRPTAAATLTQAARRLLVVLILCLTAGIASIYPALGDIVVGTNVPPTTHATWKVAAEAASSDRSLVLLDFGATWCPPCQLLKKETMNSPEFLTSGGPLHLAEIDIDADQDTASRFGISAVPTLVLLTGDGKIVQRQTGFVDAKTLLAWLRDGRRRAAAGQWEGMVPGQRLESLAERVAGGKVNLTTNELAEVTTLLGDANPADRLAAEKILLTQRERAVPPLLAALMDPYLGIRLSAADVLQRLLPEAPRLDPWQAPVDLQPGVAALRLWWSAHPTIPPAPVQTSPSASDVGTIRNAIEGLISDNSARRTEAMSTLTAHGPIALPSIRAAIKAHSRDPKVVALLEDVRWSILIPDTLERRAGSVRASLARGTSTERQAATTRLSKAGRDAISPLAELANDSDPLVVENAVRALSGIGGRDVLPAMAALLKASDSNLRMTAAQALGRTKSTEANTHLLTIIDDPNEVVACAAIAALEEINANDSPFNPAPGARQPLSQDIVDALRKTLDDSRWRVRAAGAGVIGKLKVESLTSRLKALLKDPDEFVVKSALTALGPMEAPGSEDLMAVAQRLPALQGEAVALLAKSPSASDVNSVTTLFDRSTPANQSILIAALGRRERFDSHTLTEVWQPLLEKAVRSPSPDVRRQVGGVLNFAQSNLVASLIAPLLTDEESDIRNSGAALAIGFLAGPSSESGLGFETGGIAMNIEDLDTPTPPTNGAEPSTTSTNQSAAVTEQRNVWSNAVCRLPAAQRTPVVAALAVALGDPHKELPILNSCLTKATPRDLTSLQSVPAFKLVAPKLTWPEAQPFVQWTTNAPGLYVQALSEHTKLPPPAADFLLAPATFRPTIERASKEIQQAALVRLLNGPPKARGAWSLYAGDEKTRRLVNDLLSSSNELWRCASLYAISRQMNADNRSVVEAALKDPNPWFRLTAAQALSRSGQSPTNLAETIGPLIGHDDPEISMMAAVTLLNRGLRQAAGYGWLYGYFLYHDMQAGYSDNYRVTEEEPLEVATNRPPYLELARRQLEKAELPDPSALILLLAQHGDFSMLEKMMDRLTGDHPRMNAVPTAALAAIQLSRNPAYLPHIRRWIQNSSNEWNLRNYLKAIHGMEGTEARQARLEINRRIRWPGANTDE